MPIDITSTTALKMRSPRLCFQTPRVQKKITAKKGNNSAQKKGTGAAPKEKPRPLTRMERSVAEIKQMAKIGEKDPERLAHMLAALLAKEREKQQADQENFEQQVWEIVRRSEEGEESPDGGPPSDGGGDALESGREP